MTDPQPDDLVGKDAHKLIGQYPRGKYTRIFRLTPAPPDEHGCYLRVETRLAHAQRVIDEPERNRVWEKRHARLVLNRIAKMFDDGALRNTAEDTLTVFGLEETVDHPRHYNAHPSGVECITIVEHMGFNVGSAMKYLWRAGLKAASTEVDDLRKAAWYIDREIQRLIKGA